MRLIHHTRCSPLIAVTLTWIGIAGISGCTRVKQLEPVFKVNQTNLTELSANAHSMADAIERLAGVVYDAEVRYRRVQVWSQLRSIWNDTRDRRSDDGRTHHRVWAAGETGSAVRLQQLRAALPATNNANRAKLAISDPVLCALATLEVSEDEVWHDSAIAGNAGTNATNLPDAVSDKYPAVRYHRRT